MEETKETWVLYGVEEDDPECLHTVEEATAYINEIGFLPLFKNEIPGFSLEERTISANWWCDDVKKDPWAWRTVIARQGDILYGKFFDKKAGFISKKWFPTFANYRRDGYDFDALYEDGLAALRLKKIMDLFMEEHAENVIFSNELKKQAGFGKGGEKGFDTAITSLMMMTYLCNCDFRKRKNKEGREYGWDVALLCTPEHIWGADFVRSCYNESPKDSYQRIVDYMKEVYPIATEKQIKKVLH